MYFCNISSGSYEIEQILTKYLLQLAIETENLTLNRSTVEAAVRNILSNANKGQYILLKHKALEVDFKNDIVGMNLVYYGYNILNRTKQFWLGSLYISHEHRKKGLFKEFILKFNVNLLEEKVQATNTIMMNGIISSNTISKSNFVSDLNKSIKLIVDKDNKSAIDSYLKTGFVHVKNEVIYESNVDNREYNSYRLLDSNLYHFEFLKNQNISSVIDFLIENNKENDIPGVIFILNNKDSYGNVVLLYKAKRIIGVIYSFHEPCDWRNTDIWWVYHIFISKEDMEEINNSRRPMLLYDYDKVINSFVLFNKEQKGSLIRFCLSSNEERKDFDYEKYYSDFYRNTFTERSHYLVYEKNI